MKDNFLYHIDSQETRSLSKVYAATLYHVLSVPFLLVFYSLFYRVRDME